MEPVVHGLEEKYAGRIKFSYLDINNPNTYIYQDFFNVRYQPEFYLLAADGSLLEKFIGYTSQETLEEEFAKYIE